MSGEVDFLHADKYACFLQIDSITFTGGLSSISKILKIASFQCLPDISKKKRDMKLIFLHADKHQSFPQVNFNILGIEVPFKVILLSLMNMIIKILFYTNFSKFLRTPSLHHTSWWLLLDGVHFLHEDQHQSFYKLTLLFPMEVARHVLSNQNRKLSLSDWIVFVETSR